MTDRAIEQAVRRRAAGRCEYCHITESAVRLRHVIDHIIARQHGGNDALENLALCCGRCNQFKGPNIASIDPDFGRLTRLFHPRRDNWRKHFRWEGAVLVGQTAIGRATVFLLGINDPLRLAARRALRREGLDFK